MDFDMPTRMIIAIVIEVALILLTLLFFIRPRIVVSSENPRLHAVLAGCGWVSLCVAFCWSFILGGLLVIHDMTLKG